MNAEATGRDLSQLRSARALRLIASYGVAAGCLYWVFHDISPGPLLESARQVRWSWIIASVPLNLLAYLCIAWEWKVLMGAAGCLPLGKFAQAVLAGRFVNDVLPVHAGYIARVLLVSRWTRSDVLSVVPSLAAERLIETAWLVLAIGTLAFLAPMPAGFIHTGQVLGGLTFAGGALLGLAILFSRSRGIVRLGTKGGLAKLWYGANRFAARLSGGLEALGAGRVIAKASSIAWLKLALQALAFMILLKACSIKLPLMVQIAVFLISYIGISLPSTPAGMGVFQLFSVAALTAFGVQKPTATAFSLLAFIAATVPLTLAGAVAFAQTGITLVQVRKTVAAGQSEVVPLQ